MGQASEIKTKFCRYCGGKIPEDAVLCTLCGRQVEEIKKQEATPNIIIKNRNTNRNVIRNIHGGGYGRRRNKWVALCLCLFLGFFGAHKFYEGKPGKGILYLCTAGLFGIGWIIDTIVLLFKPNPYYV